MVTAFVDTSVLMYAAGASHPLQGPCRAILERIGMGALDAVTSVEVLQEILHRSMAIGKGDAGVALVERSMNLFAPVLPITHALIRRVPDLAARYPDLEARDIVHLATCIHEGITEIITADRGFEDVEEIRRIDPLAFGA
jgi:predicted nucleic acid-binding protein